MKKILKTTATILMIALVFLQCKSSQFEKNAPFKLTKATYYNWVGEQPDVKGTNIEILGTILAENIDYQYIYFQSKKEKLYVKKREGSNFLLTANINTANRNELYLQADAKKEYGNQLPNLKNDFPFKLKDNEAIISYLQNGKEKLYKISEFIKEKDVFYP